MARVRTRRRRLQTDRERPTEPDYDALNRVADTLEQGGYTERYDNDMPGDTPAEIARSLAVSNRKGMQFKGMDKDYVQRTMLQMMQRGASIKDVAKAFDVSLVTVYRWKKDLSTRLANEVNFVSSEQIMGEALSFYDDIKKTAMREFVTTEKFDVTAHLDAAGNRVERRSLNPTAAAYRSKMLATALSAEKGLHYFLEKFGVLERLSYQPPRDQTEELKQAASLQDMVEAVFNPNSDAETLDRIMTETLGRDDKDTEEKTPLVLT